MSLRILDASLSPDVWNWIWAACVNKSFSTGLRTPFVFLCLLLSHDFANDFVGQLLFSFRYSEISLYHLSFFWRKSCGLLCAPFHFFLNRDFKCENDCFTCFFFSSEYSTCDKTFLKITQLYVKILEILFLYFVKK